MSRLNYFRMFEHKDPSHEDQLTRALLVTLRFVPIAHMAFLDLLRERQSCLGGEKVPAEDVLPASSSLVGGATTLETQVTTLKAKNGRLLSVLLTDEHWQASKGAEFADRGARYDGVISYDLDDRTGDSAGGWTIVMENKPSAANVWEDQTHPAKEQTDLVLCQTPVGLRWADLIDRIGAVVSRDVVSGAERLMLDDFLEFVDDRFPYLNPYTRFVLCKGNLYLLGRRCRSVMEGVAPSRVEYKRGLRHGIRLGDAAVQYAFLAPHSAGEGNCEIALELYPADTVSQGRSFYADLDVDRFLALSSDGWELKPNLHFGFMGTHLVWANTGLSVEEYLRKQKADPMCRQIQREAFHDEFSSMLKDGLISSSDLSDLQQKLIDTRRQSANIIPGVGLFFRWTRAESERLDDKGQFVDAVRQRIQQALATWGRSLAVER